MSSRAPLRGRESYRVWREIGTRWADNDVYGHVNNTVYYEWFDTAVNAWLIEAELLDVARGDPIGLVVETDGLRYHRTPAQQARDRVRDQAHAASGLTPLRFTHAQVDRDAGDVQRTLQAVAARLARRLTSSP